MLLLLFSHYVQVHSVVSTQSCPLSRVQLFANMDCWTGSSVQWILQARMLEWIAFPSPGYYPDPGIKPGSPALANGFFTTEAHGKPFISIYI